MLNLERKKIAVTGLTGFLGRHLAPLLAEADLACLVRPSSSKKLIPSQTQIIVGDCLSGYGLGELLRGRDIFIHMASMLFGLGWQDYLRANARACQNIMRTLESLPEKERPAKVIFISSLAAAGPCAQPPGAPETAIPAPVSAYGWSKLLCERIFSPMREKLVIIRPPIIYGSGDKGLLPMFKSAAHGIGVSPGVGRLFPVSAIHADDAARAIILACDPRASGIYHISDGKNYNMDIFCQAMAAACGKSCHMLHIPLALMAVSAVASNLFSCFMSKLSPAEARFKAPQWNLDKYREARAEGWLSDPARICGELGFKAQVSLAEGMKEAVTGYRAEGLL